MRLRTSFALLALMAAPRVAGAQPVDVVSALGPEVDREALDAVHRARDRYAELGLELRKPYAPTRIILTPTALELAPYIGSSVGRSRAVSFVGADRNYILVAWEAPGSPLRAAAHEYAHLVDPLADAPVWFREGFAEYLSYLDDGRALTPARHLVRLRDSPWLSLHALRGAARSSEEFHAPTFYAQAWLTVHWLASRGKAPRHLRPGDLDEAVGRLGTDGLEAALRAHFGEMAVPPEEDDRLWTMPQGTYGDDWRVRLALAEADSELGRRERAAGALEKLQAERPGEPAIAAALGALAMDEGRYAAAESSLKHAAAAPGATARTHYRLALLLLRPVNGPERERAVEAAEHARRALEQFPSSPDYRLALAQALMVSEDWEASARELNTLSVQAGWRGRANEEMEELVRRRQQAVAGVERPAPESQPHAQPAPTQPLELAAVPPPPKPPPPPPMRWPPPGADIVAGRIDYVDCSSSEKIIVLRHPLLNLRFRSPKGKPAKLFLPPQRDWTEIPCGAKGWTVNIAYYPYSRRDGITGDAIAILF